MTRRLEGRLVALGVTGSIAAYKAVELLRLLTAEGADVVVLLSPSATRFVGPLSFAALSRHPVESDVLDLLPDGRIGHIVIADSADAVVVAPATAHWLAAMANGLAGDVVTAAALATSAPVVVAPAMDGDMWTHPATVANVARLREGFGYTVVAPEAGPLASGQSGVGRLAELPTIVDAVVAAVSGRPVRQPKPEARPPIAAGPPREADLVGRRIVITAGGTREPIDPVRYIGNRSTGRMGVALAEVAASTAAGSGPAPILVGFAAETGGLDRAPAKLRSKGIDLLVANDVSEAGSGFGTETNRVTIFDRDGSVDALPLLSKREVADRILDRVARALDARDAAVQTAGEHATRAQERRPA